MQIDLNCDLGEGCAHDAELMPLITSANISCGFHAGGPETANAALRLAAEQGVAAGAHPGFDDRKHFGRCEIEMPAEAVTRLVLYQVGALAALAEIAMGGDGQEHRGLRFIKPHGALYNMACRDLTVARAIVEAAVVVKLPLVGLPQSRLEEAAAGRCRFIAEGFADRRYQADGSLVPRSQSNAFVEDVADAVRQAEWLMRERGIQTLCVHGDNPQALAFVRELRSAFQARGIVLRACT
jgi:UPF0271 protein